MTTTHLDLVTAPSATTPPGVVRSAVAGAIAAAAALATGELVTALIGAEPSLVTAVGAEFVDRFAASLKNIAVALFDTNDKAALVVGIVVSSLLLGALIGLVARRRLWVAPAGFGAFGLLGAWALASDPQGSLGVAIISAAVAAVTGTVVLAGLLRLGRRHTPSPTPGPTAAPAAVTSPALERRRFVLGVGGVTVVAAAGGVLARRIRADDGVDAARRATVLPRSRLGAVPPRSQPLVVDGLSPYVTPNADFYRIDTALSTPHVDADGWQLRVGGMVDTPYELTYDDLLALPSVTETVTIACVSNEVGGHLVGNAVWQGVPLAAILARAGVAGDASQLVGRSVDGWTAGFPVAEALDGRTAIVAYAMNGEPLPASHGYPARLIVAGLYGYVSATKWLEEIELTRWEQFDGYWVPRGWAKEGPIKTASRIDVPRSGAPIAAGPLPIAGVAWAPGRGIARVEIQIDGGRWLPCELGRVASSDTWVQWRHRWDAPPGDHVLRVRATDGNGITQTDEVAAPAPDGATGWHTRRVHIT